MTDVFNRQITFNAAYFNEAADAPLKTRLENFFSRADVQEKLALVNDYIFPTDTLRPRDPYPISSLIIKDFVQGGAQGDGDPHNLCAAVYAIYRGAMDEKQGMPAPAKLGLEGIAQQLTTLVQMHRSYNPSPLKKEILLAAKAAGFTGSKEI